MNSADGIRRRQRHLCKFLMLTAGPVSKMALQQGKRFCMLCCKSFITEQCAFPARFNGRTGFLCIGKSPGLRRVRCFSEDVSRRLKRAWSWACQKRQYGKWLVRSCDLNRTSCRRSQRQTKRGGPEFCKKRRTCSTCEVNRSNIRFWRTEHQRDSEYVLKTRVYGISPNIQIVQIWNFKKFSIKSLSNI